MKPLAVQVDRLLRGEFSKSEDLRAGRIDVPARTLVLAGLALGVIYGLCMGLFPLLYNRPAGWAQVFATAIKVPLLYLLTLAVTFPSLYVFSALCNSRLRFRETMRLLLMTIGINLAVLASLGPVTVFFTLSTRSYAFMKLLNVLFFGIAGLVSLAFLARATDDVFETQKTATNSERLRSSSDGKVRRIFLVWLLIYSVVGAQMGWILRPFLGAPGLEFEMFRGTESNFFQDVLESLYWQAQG